MTIEVESTQVAETFEKDVNKLCDDINAVIQAHNKQVDEIERLNSIINEALGIANERFNYYSNHKSNNEEHLEDWGNIFNALVRRDEK